MALTLRRRTKDGTFKHNVTVRHTTEHRGGQIPDFHEWYLPGSIVYRDSIGRENNGTGWSWMVLECNNPGCEGQALVRLDDFTTGIPLGVVWPQPEGTQEKYDTEMRKQRGENA